MSGGASFVFFTEWKRGIFIASGNTLSAGVLTDVFLKGVLMSVSRFL